MRTVAMAVALAGALAACSGTDPIRPTSCDLSTLPLAGSALAPSVRDVALEVQSSGIVVLATVTDPQGSASLADVQQTIGVYRNRECTGSPILMTDDLAGSGVEESFGTAVARSVDGPLYDAIAAAQTWPVALDFRNRDGQRTAGTVMARVVR